MKIKILLLSLFFFLFLACNILTPINQSQAIGFDFSGKTPHTPTGDRNAATHLFIHKYPFPSTGRVTGITFLNDTDGGTEAFSLLILRPTDDGWEVIHRVDISDEDIPVTKTGSTSIQFETALDVVKGDLFAHWQPDDTGPIPLNDENSSIEGLSFGKVGFHSEDIEEGQFILNQGFSGGRDYFINLIFEATP